MTTTPAATPGDPAPGPTPESDAAPAEPPVAASPNGAEVAVAPGDGAPGDGAPVVVGATPSGSILPRALVILVGSAALVIVVAGMRGIAWLVAPTAMALVIVIAVAPIQTWLLRKRWPGWATTVVLMIAVFAVILSLAFGIIVSIARLATTLPQYAGQFDKLVSDATAQLAKFGVGPDQLKQAAGSLDMGKIAGVLEGLLSSVAGLATSLVFLLALLLFLSVEASGVGDRLASIAEERAPVAGALRDFAHGTRVYLVVTTVFGLIVAILDSIALAIMGIPLAITWGLLAFVTNYIPNVGFILGVIPPALLGLLTGGPTLMIAVIVVYCALNFVIQSLLQPRFIGDAVGLSVTITFLSLVFWAWLLGALGAILAIPLTLLGKALLVDIDPKARWADALLRATGKAPDPNAPAKVRKKRRLRRRDREQPAPV